MRRPATARPSIVADESGGIAILAAFLMPILVGGMALGAETGSWYLQQRKLQHAADMAAYAGAIRLMQGDTKEQLTPAAQHVATNTGFGTGSFTLNIPPSSGACSPANDCVEVIVEEQRPRYLTALFGSGPVTLSARAVAKFILDTGAKGCVLALDKTAKVGVKISGNAAVTFNGCEVVSNSTSTSSFMMQSGAAVVTTDCIRLAGEADVNNNADINLKCSAIAEQRPPITDPYKNVQEPSTTLTCHDKGKTQVKPQEKVTFTPTLTDPTSGLPAMHFCGGLTLQGTATFKPGIYIINGNLTINSGATVNSLDDNNNGVTEGVMFYIYNNGGVKMNGSANLTLSPITAAQHPVTADRTWSYAGLLFFSARSNTSQMQINGGSSSTISGAVYAAGAEIQFSGNTSASGNGCMQLIGATVDFTGNSGVAADCSSIGGSTIYSNPMAALFE